MVDNKVIWSVLNLFFPSKLGGGVIWKPPALTGSKSTLGQISIGNETRSKLGVHGRTDWTNK